MNWMTAAISEISIKPRKKLSIVAVKKTSIPAAVVLDQERHEAFVRAERGAVQAIGMLQLVAGGLVDEAQGPRHGEVQRLERLPARL